MTAVPQHAGPDMATKPPGPTPHTPTRHLRSHPHPPLPRTLTRALPLSPALVLLLLFLAGPIAYCAYLAFTDLQLTGQAHSSFVGLANFRTAFKDTEFLNAVWLTIVFTVLSSLI